jgi:hypothetical protein
MSFYDFIGTLGVSLLLLAFFLNLFGFISQEGKVYILTNLLGAAIACYASVLIGFIPFVILEGTWGLISFLALVRPLIKKV